MYTTPSFVLLLLSALTSAIPYFPKGSSESYPTRRNDALTDKFLRILPLGGSFAKYAL